MIQAFFRWTYRSYMQIMKHAPHGASQPDITELQFRRAHAPVDPAYFPAIDANATQRGELYRGAGIIIGILGTLIVFCAVAPTGFQMNEAHETYVGMLKVTLMLLALGLVFFIQKKKLKKKWVYARQHAEKLRYLPLQAAIEKASSEHPASLTALERYLNALLNGPDGQIRYNQLKHEQYEAIEAATGKITLAGFALSLIGAVAHLAYHAAWLIFLTAFVPALVGTFHGVNGFLRLEHLADHHLQLAIKLEFLHKDALAALEGDKTSAFIECARQIHGLLVGGDHLWTQIAIRQEVSAP